MGRKGKERKEINKGGRGEKYIKDWSEGRGLFKVFIKPLLAAFGADEEDESPNGDSEGDKGTEKHDSHFIHDCIL
jgi:hypothetical protein